MLTLALAVVAVLLWRRFNGRLRLVIVVVALPLVCYSLLVCFEHVSLALPGSY